MGEWDNIIHAGDMYSFKKKLAPKVDKIVSDIVGHDVLQGDPRLINLIVQRKKQRGSQDSVSSSSDVADNLFIDPQFIKELKTVFSKQL